MTWLVGIRENPEAPEALTVGFCGDWTPPVQRDDSLLNARFFRLGREVPHSQAERYAAQLMAEHRCAVVIGFTRAVDTVELGTWLAQRRPLSEHPALVSVYRNPESPADLIAALTRGVGDA